MKKSSQSGEQSFPPNNLPGQLTSFVGRTNEIEEIRRLLDTNRSLTLVGTGGVGKTRLCLETVSGDIERFQDGVWFIELGSLFEPDLMVTQIYATMDLRGISSDPSLDDLSAYLVQKKELLIFDNCEHLVLVCAQTVDHLLRTCPGVSILSTSREPLGYPGETTYQVPAMKIPQMEDISDLKKIRSSEAAVLLVERIQNFQPEFQIDRDIAPTIIQICNQLEGIPLALELAAASTKYLSVSQIAEKLENSLELLTRGSRTSQPRQQTLRATIDWSYSYLNEVEQSLFRRIAVFRGEFTLEDGEGVCCIGSKPFTQKSSHASDLQPEMVLDLLSNLVDKSLLMVRMDGEAIYRMLIPVRKYAREKLIESGEYDDLRKIHLSHYLDLAERAKVGVRGKEQIRWLDRLEIEHDNMRAALGSSSDLGYVEDGLRLASALRDFWFRHGYLTEGVRWLKRLLEAEHPQNLYHANALVEAGILNYEYGNLERAKKYGRESLNLYEKFNHAEGIAQALYLLGVCAHFAGDRQRGILLLEDSLKRFRDLEDYWSVARTLLYLGDAYLRSENYHQAAFVVDECLTLFRQLGDVWGIAFALGTSGELARKMGDYELARNRFFEDLAMQYEQGNKVDVCYLLESIAKLSVDQDNAERAAILWGAAESLRELYHAPMPPSYQVDVAPHYVLAREQIGESAFTKAWVQGSKLSMEQVIEFALKDQIDEPGDAHGATVKETKYQARQFDLTLREIEVLRLVAEGKTDVQVAEQLYISPRTVGKHLQSIYQKLQVSSRTAAARVAIDYDML